MAARQKQNNIRRDAGQKRKSSIPKTKLVKQAEQKAVNPQIKIV